jgi:hypothetical protein
MKSSFPLSLSLLLALALWAAHAARAASITQYVQPARVSSSSPAPRQLTAAERAQLRQQLRDNERERQQQGKAPR